MIRHSAPTKLDQSDIGTICRVNLDDDEFELYLQMSLNSDIPNWMNLGKFTSKDSDSYVADIIAKTLNKK